MTKDRWVVGKLCPKDCTWWWHKALYRARTFKAAPFDASWFPSFERAAEELMGQQSVVPLGTAEVIMAKWRTVRTCPASDPTDAGRWAVGRYDAEGDTWLWLAGHSPTEYLSRIFPEAILYTRRAEAISVAKGRCLDLIPACTARAIVEAWERSIVAA